MTTAIEAPPEPIKPPRVARAEEVRDGDLPPVPGSAPRKRSRTRIRPTLFGSRAVIFYGVVTLAYYASPYTNLFFLLFSFLSVVLIVNVMWSGRNVKFLSGRVEDIAPFAADSVGECSVVLDAPPTRKAPALHTEILVRLAERPHGKLSLRTQLVTHALVVDRRLRLRGRLPRLPRGIWEVRAFEATSTYPLGLLRACRVLDAPTRLVVYPTPMAESLLERSGVVRGKGEELADGPPLRSSQGETAGLREYQTGDSIRHVHWRASARSTRGLVVREFEPIGDRSVEVRLDRRCDDAEVFERALSAVTRLALTAQEFDEPFVLRSQGYTARFGPMGRSYDELWEWLAITSPCEGHEGEAPAAQSPDAVDLPAALSRLGGGA